MTIAFASTAKCLRIAATDAPTAMPPPQKAYKTLNHKDTQYRWIMQNLRGVNELRVVASAPVNGQVLIATLPRVVSNHMVPQAIDFAHAHGWTPNETAPPLHCTHRHHGFQLDPANS